MPTAAAAKLVTVFGLLGKVEASYAASTSLASATDGILLAAEAVGAISWVHKGEHAPAAWAGGVYLSAAPSGRAVKLPVKIEARGAGATYTTAVVPPDLHTLLRCSGHAATLAAAAYTYTPVSTGFDSGSFAAYARGELFSINGAYADMSFAIDAGGFCVFDFTIDGLMSDPTDVTLPTITYNTTQPAKAESLAVAIGAWSAPTVKKLTFKKGFVVGPRLDMNQAGHAGFACGRRKPELVITVEEPAIATFDPYAAWKAGTTEAISFTIGSAANNKMTFNAAQGQITDVKASAEGPVGTLDLTISCNMTLGGANDDYKITFAA